jgi:polyphosphate kinase 2
MNKINPNKKMDLSDEDIQLLNSRYGMKYLFSDNRLNLEKSLRLARYDKELRELQAELVKLQSWVIRNGKKVVIIFEGRDASGKGGAIRRITAYINPRHYRIVALPKANAQEKGQWYFKRYVNLLPKPGEIVFFDRSWYNRAIIEPANKFCSDSEYKLFMNQVNDFEKMILDENTYLIKFYFSIKKEEQSKRFAKIKKNSLKKWKLSPLDWKAQDLWDVYTKYKNLMIDKGIKSKSPWIVINANVKTEARLEALKYILKKVPYK